MGDGNGLFADALAFLAADVLADIADSLALVRLGWIEAADFGGELADELLIDPLDDDMVLVGAGDLQPFRNRFVDFVGEAGPYLQYLAATAAR